MSPKDFVYDLPEDYVLSNERREKLDSLMEELNVTDNALAQKLIDFHVEIVEEVAEACLNLNKGT